MPRQAALMCCLWAAVTAGASSCKGLACMDAWARSDVLLSAERGVGQSQPVWAATTIPLQHRHPNITAYFVDC